MIPTYQDMLEATDLTKFVESAIGTYKTSEMYLEAKLADEYDAQRNPTIAKTIRSLFDFRVPR